MRTIKPTSNTKCVECRELIGEEPHYWTKSRGYPPVFVHKKCYESLLPKKGKSNDKQEDWK